MKKLTALLILMFVLINYVAANDLFLYDTTEKIELGDVVSNKLVVVPTIIGNTYTLNNNLSVVTTTNSTATYALPYKIVVYQKENSSAFFNVTPTEYVNDFKLPEVLKIKDSQFNFSFQGELYCASESAKQSVIATSMSTIVFDKATLFIKAGDKFTHVYLVDGKVTVLDNKSKKKKELKPNDYLVITPQATLSPKDSTVRNLGNSFSIKEVEDVEKDAHVVEIKALQTKLSNVLFVNYGTNIFGLKLHQ